MVTKLMGNFFQHFRQAAPPPNRSSRICKAWVKDRGQLAAVEGTRGAAGASGSFRRLTVVFAELIGKYWGLGGENAAKAKVKDAKKWRYKKTLDTMLKKLFTSFVDKKSSVDVN